MFLLRLAIRLALGVLILVVAAAVAGDFYARSRAEKLVSERVKSDTGAQSVSVDLGSFPFLYHVAFSSLPDVRVVAHQVPAGRFRMDEVTVDAVPRRGRPPLAAVGAARSGWTRSAQPR